jgi:hypothetical protein
MRRALESAGIEFNDEKWWRSRRSAEEGFKEADVIYPPLSSLANWVRFEKYVADRRR